MLSNLLAALAAHYGPTFSLYRLLTGVFGGRYVAVPLGDAFAFDVGRLIDVAVRERARVIVVNSPNPTGPSPRCTAGSFPPWWAWARSSEPRSIPRSPRRQASPS